MKQRFVFLFNDSNTNEKYYYLAFKSFNSCLFYRQCPVPIVFFKTFEEANIFRNYSSTRWRLKEISPTAELIIIMVKARYVMNILKFNKKLNKWEYSECHNFKWKYQYKRYAKKHGILISGNNYVTDNTEKFCNVYKIVDYDKI